MITYELTCKIILQCSFCEKEQEVISSFEALSSEKMYQPIDLDVDIKKLGWTKPAAHGGELYVINKISPLQSDHWNGIYFASGYNHHPILCPECSAIKDILE